MPATSNKGNVAHALLRAVSRLISTLSPLDETERSHECERGTHECVRHIRNAD